MTLLLACVSLMIVAGAIVWAARPGQLVPDSEPEAETKPFSLQQAIVLAGTEINDPECRGQRSELRRILSPLLDAGYRIVEVYGDNPPTQNGEVYDWLDNQLLRDCLSAQDGFHLIFVDRAGQRVFHARKPLVAEAMLHVFDLWSLIEGEAGEALAERIDERAEPTVQESDPANDPANDAAGVQTTFSFGPEPAPAEPSHGFSAKAALTDAGLRTDRVLADTASPSLRPVGTFAFTAPLPADDRGASAATHTGSPGRHHPQRRAPSRIAAMVRQRRA